MDFLPDGEDETTVLRAKTESDLVNKAKEALASVIDMFNNLDPPVPPNPRICGATLLKNRSLLLEFSTAETARWVSPPDIRKASLSLLGFGATIKDRLYQVILQFTPIELDTLGQEGLRTFEQVNGLEEGAVVKAG